MIDEPLLTFSDAIQRTGHDLASMSGIDLQSAGPATVRAWEARGLALHHLATGDMAEALKVMDAARPAAAPVTQRPIGRAPRRRRQDDQQRATARPAPPAP